MSIALDTVSMLVDSAAHLWQRLEQYAPLTARPQRSSFDSWFAAAPSATRLDTAEIFQAQRDYRRLCGLLDQLETVVPNNVIALDAIRSRIARQAER